MILALLSKTVVCIWEITFEILKVFNFPLLGNFNQMVCGNSKLNNLGFLYGFIYINNSGLLCSVTLSVWMWKSQRILKDSFSVQGKVLCSYHFSDTLKPLFLEISQYKFFLIQSCSRLYSFWRSLGHSKIIWVIVSSLASLIRHLWSSLVPSIFILMLLVLMYWLIMFLSLNDHSVTSPMILCQQYSQYLWWTGHGVFYSSNLVFFWFAVFFNFLSRLCYFLFP